MASLVNRLKCVDHPHSLERLLKAERTFRLFQPDPLELTKVPKELFFTLLRWMQDPEHRFPKIIFIAERHKSGDGWGDLIFSKKMKEVLERRFGLCSPELYSKDWYTKNSFMALPPGLETPMIKELNDVSKHSQTLLLHGPILRSRFLNPFPSGADLLHIEEYDLTDVSKELRTQLSTPIAESGLKGWGIFFDESLFQKSLELELSSDSSLLKQLEHSSLSHLLLDPKAQDPSGQFPKLFFGYSNHFTAIHHFCVLIVRSHLGMTGSLDICLPVTISENNLNFLKEWVSRYISDEELHRVEFLKWDEGSKTFSSLFTASSGQAVPQKTLRLILPGTLRNGDIQKLLLASQPLFLCTGDQSLSEGLSARKILFYDYPAHKRSLNNALREICEKINAPGAAQFFRKDGSVSHLEDYIESSAFRESLQPQFRALAEEIRQHHNLETRLCAEVVSWLRHPEAAVKTWIDQTTPYKARNRKDECLIM